MNVEAKPLPRHMPAGSRPQDVPAVYHLPTKVLWSDPLELSLVDLVLLVCGERAFVQGSAYLPGLHVQNILWTPEAPRKNWLPSGEQVFVPPPSIKCNMTGSSSQADYFFQMGSQSSSKNRAGAS